MIVTSCISGIYKMQFTASSNMWSQCLKTSFSDEEMRQDAVIRQLSIIGEAAGDLSEEFRREYPSIPWSDIYGMRNKIVHDYFGVDLHAVWSTVEDDLQSLSQTVEMAISKAEEEP